MDSCRSELKVERTRLLSDGFDYRVAVKNGRIVGFYALEKDSCKVFELEALFVEPDYIGCGIGRLLIDHALRNVTERGGGIFLIQGDPHAAEFYSAVGVKYIGTRESESIPGRFLPLFKIDVRPSEADVA